MKYTYTSNAYLPYERTNESLINYFLLFSFFFKKKPGSKTTTPLPRKLRSYQRYPLGGSDVDIEYIKGG